MMPRYYFHCQLGDVIAEDAEGDELAGVEAARHKPPLSLGELARDELPAYGAAPDLIVRVMDFEQQVLFRMKLLHGAGD